MSISEARARLPELARYVVARPGAVVVIENRRMEEAVALTSVRHLEALERQVRERSKEVGMGFVLKGSIETDLSDAELEAAFQRMRAEQASLEVVRLEGLAL